MSADPSIRLIVNADGYGRSEAVSRGILQAHLEGIVTSTSIVANAQQPAETIAQTLRTTPTLGTGLQVVLVGGRPVSPPGRIGSLVGDDGAFASTVTEFMGRWAKAQIVQEHLEEEIEAQARRLLDAGLGLDHINTHLHLGFIPQVSSALEKVASRLGIMTLRTVMERPSLSWFNDVPNSLPLAAMAGLSWWSRKHMGVRRHGAQTWGYAETGDLDPMRILEIIGRLGPGIHELICHPGQTDTEELTPSGRRLFQRAKELSGLCSEPVRAALRHKNVLLVRFSEVFSTPAKL